MERDSGTTSIFNVYDAGEASSNKQSVLEVKTLSERKDTQDG